MPRKGKPTIAQAYKAAAKPKNKGIIGEGKDVLNAAANSVKQQAEFVVAVNKGAAKGAKAVAGKVADITVGDVASAPLDSAKAVVKGAGKVAAKVGSMLGGSKKSLGSMAKGSMAKKASSKKNYPKIKKK